MYMEIQRRRERKAYIKVTRIIMDIYFTRITCEAKEIRLET